MEGLQQFFLGSVFIPCQIQRQHGQKRPGQSQVVGPLHIAGHIGDDPPLEEFHVALPVPGRHAVFQLGHQLPQLLRPAGGDGVGHVREVAQDIPLDMGGGAEVGIAAQKLQDVGPDAAGGGPGVRVAQQGEQRPAEAGARPELPHEKVQQLFLVHPEHLQNLTHLLGDPLAHAGEDHGPLPPGEEPGEALRHAGGVPQALEEGLVIGIVPDLAVPLEVVVLPVGSLVRSGDPAGVWDILHRRIVRRHRQIPVCDRFVIPRYRIGCS